MVSTICFDMELSMLRIRFVGLLSVGLCVRRATGELVTRSRYLRGRVEVQNRGTGHKDIHGCVSRNPSAQR